MPVQFLTPEQIAQYGHYAGEPSPRQLSKYFHLDDRDLKNVDVLDKEHTRLGFAVQLGTVRFLGTFLADMREVPAAVVNYMAAQLQVESSSWPKYSERSQRRHKKMIRRLYGYEDFHQSLHTFSLVRHLYARA
jgi:hypothetical protein